MAAQLIAGSFGALQSIYEGRNAKKNAKRQSKSLLAEAGQVLASGKQEATVLRRRGSEVTGTARAQYGGTGVDVNTGTASLVQQTISERAEFDALTSILQSKLQAQALRHEAKGVRKAGKSAQISGYIGAGASLAGAFK